VTEAQKRIAFGEAALERIRAEGAAADEKRQKQIAARQDAIEKKELEDFRRRQKLVNDIATTEEKKTLPATERILEVNEKIEAAKQRILRGSKDEAADVKEIQNLLKEQSKLEKQIADEKKAAAEQEKELIEEAANFADEQHAKALQRIEEVQARQREAHDARIAQIDQQIAKEQGAIDERLQGFKKQFAEGQKYREVYDQLNEQEKKLLDTGRIRLREFQKEGETRADTLARLKREALESQATEAGRIDCQCTGL